jgi:hypothetical protein
MVVQLSEGRRKQVLPFIDPAAALAEPRAAIKPNAKTKKKARGQSGP